MAGTGDGVSFELEGGIGKLDYGGATLEALDELAGIAAVDVVRPEVVRRIHHITRETARSVKVKRLGFFSVRGRLDPAWQIVTDIAHGKVLEYFWGGKYSYLRKAARSRIVSRGISAIVKRRFGPAMRAQVRKRKRKKR